MKAVKILVDARNGVLMFDARKRVCEWIFVGARNRRVLMLGNGRLHV